MSDADSPRTPAIIELATPEHAPFVRKLMSEGLSPFDVDTELVRPYARLWLARPGLADAEPVGFLLAWEVADEAHLIDLIVLSSWRLRGFGRALGERLILHAKERGLRAIFLEVRRGNVPARRLYAALGFELTGERKAYYPDGEDALLMSLGLRPC
jgi:ribosomal protein S18 acetylase RimI-like enzyme